MQHNLIIEDEQAITELQRDSLEMNGFTSAITMIGEEIFTFH